MGKVSTNQKLQLIRSIRAESQDNRMAMRNRERILYGIESKAGEELPLYAKGYYDGREKELYALEDGSSAMQRGSFSFFKLRLMLSAVLFCVFLVADSGSGNIGGFSTDMIREEINKDFDAGFDEVVFDFEDNFPYTLFSKE